MIEHVIDPKRCNGCGKCVEICNLGLWEIIEVEGGKSIARTVSKAGAACHFCFFCKDICPRNAVTITAKEDEVLGRIPGSL
jgi:NAD-dependent dihydropyrimidine dehydrogenase PreA subunit